MDARNGDNQPKSHCVGHGQWYAWHFLVNRSFSAGEINTGWTSSGIDNCILQKSRVCGYYHRHCLIRTIHRCWTMVVGFTSPVLQLWLYASICFVIHRRGTRSADVATKKLKLHMSEHHKVDSRNMNFIFPKVESSAYHKVQPQDNFVTRLRRASSRCDIWPMRH